MAWVEGLQSAGVAACLKHFPGHGDTATDSHLALPTIDAPLDVLARRELVPFAAAIAAGAAAVMTSHILVSALDDTLPATLSPAVLGHLRSTLGFEGVIVSDALDMAGASRGRGIPEAAVLALAAGVDLLCVGPDKDEALVRSIQTAIVAAVAEGRLAEDRLAEAVDRIAAMPRGGGLALRRTTRRRSWPEPGPRSASRATCPTSPVPCSCGSRPSPTSPSAPCRGACPRDVVGPAGLSPETDRPVVVQARDAHRHPETLALLADLAQRVPVVLVDYGWPGPLTVPVVRVVTHGGSRPSYAAVEELLRARGWRP